MVGLAEEASALRNTDSSHLGVASHILKEASDTPEGLVEVRPLSQRLRDCLEDFLILFGVCLVDLFRRTDVLFQVTYCVFPGLQSLGEEARGLRCQKFG